MNICMKVITIALMVACCLAAGVAQAEVITIWNAADDFSIASNPNGVWSYGRQSSGTAFSAFTAGRTWGDRNVAYAGIEVWDGGDGNYDPSVDHNSTDGTIVAFGFTFAPNALGLDSYYGNEDPGWPAVRWTAPEAGTIDIAATFTDGANFYAGAYVFVKGVLNYVGTADSTGISWSSNGISVAAGDTVEFLTAGPGTVTMLDATITHTAEVPEPTTMALLVIGGFCIVGIIKRRNR